MHKRLRTGWRYPRGCWRKMDSQIWIHVIDGYIVKAAMGNRLWKAAWGDIEAQTLADLAVLVQTTKENRRS